MVDRLEDDQIKISHPKIILDIINQVKLAPKKTRQTLELAPKFLCHNTYTPIVDKRFQYCGYIRGLKFLKNSTLPNISCATHQYIHF